MVFFSSKVPEPPGDGEGDNEDSGEDDVDHRHHQNLV